MYCVTVCSTAWDEHPDVRGPEALHPPGEPGAVGGGAGQAPPLPPPCFPCYCSILLNFYHFLLPRESWGGGGGRGVSRKRGGEVPVLYNVY